jgi:hypothetical protein
MSTTLTPVLSAFWDDARSWTLETYERNGGYQALRAAVTDGARRGRHHGQGLGPARPRRRRLPDRAEVELPAQARRPAPLPGGQRRRVRAGDLQGHPR